MSAIAAIIPVEQPVQLAQLDRARQMLAECRTLPEIKQIRDIAEAAKVYAKAAHLGRESQNYAAEIALLAARKAGEILAQMEKSNGGRPEKTPAAVAGVSEYRQTLTDSQTPERTAQQWQALAGVPQPTFDNYISESNARKKEITAAGLLRLAPREENRPVPHHLELLQQHLSRLCPSRNDSQGENIFVQLLEMASTVTISAERAGLADTISKMLRKHAKDCFDAAEKIEQNMPQEKVT